MYDRPAVGPYPHRSTFGAREYHVDFDTEFHELGRLLRRPARAVGGLCNMKYSYFYVLDRSSQRCV